MDGLWVLSDRNDIIKLIYSVHSVYAVEQIVVMRNNFLSSGHTTEIGGGKRIITVLASYGSSIFATVQPE